MSSSGTSRTYGPTLIALLGGGVLAWWTLAQVWVSVTVKSAFGSQIHSVTGAELYPWAQIAAWIALACLLAIIATTGFARRFIAGLVALCGVALACSALIVATRDSVVIDGQLRAVATAENFTVAAVRFGTLAAGLLILGTAVSIWIYGPLWRGLSARQSGTGQARGSMWDALDRGDDPTVDPPNATTDREA